MRKIGLKERANALLDGLSDTAERKTFRWSAIWEAIFFIAAVIIVDAIFAQGDRFVTVGFHPFWFIILLVTMLYGLEEGLIVVILATTALYFGNIPAQKITEDQYEYFLRIIFNPVMWLLFVFFIGSLRNREIGRMSSLREILYESDLKTRDIGNQYAKVASINTILETKLAGGSQTIFTVYDAIKDMEASNVPAILNGAVSLMRTVISPDRFSFFLLNRNVLEARFTSGWTIEDNFVSTITSSSPLYKEIVENKRRLCINRPADLDVLSGAIMAVPIIHEATGKVFGMIKIERMPFSDLRHQNIEGVAVIGKWLGNSLHNESMIGAAKSQSIVDPELSVMSATFYKKQVHFLEKLGQRCKFSVSAINFSVDQERMSHKDNMNFSALLARTVEGALRSTDLVFVSPSEDLSYAIILPNTDAKGAAIVLDKMLSQIRKQTIHHNMVKHAIQVIYENKPDK